MASFAPCTETRIPESGKFGTRKKVCWKKFVTAYHPVKETNPTTSIWRSPRLKAKFYMGEKSKNENSYSGSKKKTALLPVKLETFPSRLHHKSRMRWHNRCSRGVCVDCVSRVNVSSLSLKGGSRETMRHKGTERGRMINPVPPPLPPPPLYYCYQNPSLGWHDRGILTLPCKWNMHCCKECLLNII